MVSEIKKNQIDEMIELAKAIQTSSGVSSSNPFADRMATIIQSPESKHFLIRLMDVAFRSHNFDRVSTYIVRLFNSTNAHKQLFNISESILVRLFRIIGYKLPSVSIPLMLEQIQQVTSPVIFFKDSSSFRSHIDKRKKHGIELNINPIGETLIGENEAKERLNKYLEILNEPKVNYVSIKLSTLHSQILAIGHDNVIQDCIERLSVLYREVLKIKEELGVTKFINLDMEEFKDLSITYETFVRTLNKKEFKFLRAGIVLQAYLPESYKVAKDLQAWSIKRVENGGFPVKVRIVKGANYEMEKTESSMRGWPLATYNSKVDTDANFKKILLELLTVNSTKCLNVGIASHNIFDLSFCLHIVQEQKLHTNVDFEMLEGMAKSTVIELNKRGANLILYTPIVQKENYLNAIAYLVRRLDEGTQDGNFLKEGFDLKVGSEKWKELKEHFLESLKLINQVQTNSNRTQNRLSEVCSFDADFENTPDTDWTCKSNRDWLEAIKEKWSNPNKIDLYNIPVVGKSTNGNRIKIKQKNWEGELSWTYEQATEEDFESMISASSAWYSKNALQRGDLLKKAAVEIAKKRGDLIGITVAELGKLPSEVDVEISEAIDFANYYAESILQIEEEGIEYLNKGINLVLSPWNFPIAIPIGGVLASLAAGKRVILKPSQNAAATAFLISQCLWDAGIPKDAFAFLPTSDSILDKYLSFGNIFDAVILTGGTDTAQFLLKRNPYLNLFAETGGKNATIITALADREQAISNVVDSAFGNTGQKCSATSVLILEKEVYENKGFRALLKDATQSRFLGKPWDNKTKIGPMAVPINDKIKHVLKITKDEEWLLKPVQTGDFILSPGIKWGITQNSYEYQNELFGPILCVMKASGLGEAIKFVNDSPFGLTSGIESLAREEVRYWKSQIKVGNLYANRSTTGAIVKRQPFGGIKASSYGFGMKAGGPNYVRQFLRLIPKSNSTIKQEYQNAFHTYFKKEVDSTKIRGQHNILRYLKPKKVFILIDKDSTELNLKMIVEACKVLKCKFEIVTTSADLKVTSHKINKLENFNQIFTDFDPDTVIRSLITKLPRFFQQECHTKNIHIYKKKPSENGRMELLNYLTEQSLSINYHRYGNLMGEKSMKD